MATKAQRIEHERQAVANLELALTCLRREPNQQDDTRQAIKEAEANLIERRARLARLEAK